MSIRCLFLGAVAWVLKAGIVILSKLLCIVLEYSEQFPREDASPKLPNTVVKAAAVRTFEMDKLCSQMFRCPEILAVIFKVSDFARLKKCRLVCKGWNKEICRSVGREHWVASLSKRRHLTLFREMMESRRNTQELPLPFDKIDMMAQAGIVKGSYFWLPDHDLKITKLNLKQTLPSYSVGLVRVESADFLLQTFSSTLTHLAIHYWPSEIKEQPLPFPQLEVLELLYCSRDNHDELAQSTDFFLRIISAAPKLRRLRIGSGSLVPDILRGADLSSLEQLEIKGSAELKMSSPAALRSLTDLAVFANWREPASVERLKEDLSRFSDRLLTLKLWTENSSPPSGITLSTFLLFPQLTTLRLRCYKPSSGLDLSCFPSLMYFSCDYLNVRESPSAAVAAAADHPLMPSLSVRTVSVNLGVLPREHESTGSKATSSELKLAACLQLFSNFPKAESWELPYECAVSFCRAAASSGALVKSLGLRFSYRILGDEERLLHDDRFVFSYLERLKDLESLGFLNNDNFNTEGERCLKALDFKKMPYLKTFLYCCPSDGDKAPDFHNLHVQGRPELIIFRPKHLDGTEEILSEAGIGFRTGGSSPHPLHYGVWKPLYLT